MKKIKILCSLVIIALVFNFIPLQYYYAIETVNYIEITSNIHEYLPVINKMKRNPTIIEATSNAVVNTNTIYWQKKDGNGWKYYSKNVFEEGTYRYHFGIYIDSKVAQTPKNITVVVDSVSQQCESTLIDGKYYIYAYSKEYTATNSDITSHKVTFNSNGGTQISDKYIEHGKPIISHGIPYKKGYIFTGWHSDPLLTKKFDFATPITNDITLYAGWIDEKYKKGDLDRNNIIDANDASIALELYKSGNATSEDIEIGDMDNNNLIDSNDASLILEAYKAGN